MTTAPALIDPADVDDLRRRLARTRPPVLPGADGWTLGVDAVTLARLLRRWADGFDLAAFDERIQRLPWAQAGALRVVHQRAAGDGAPAVVLLHGWPDSVLRFERVLPLLRDVDVVVPALPGFPFANPKPLAGTTVVTMAHAVDDAMRALGYERYVVSGGDVGGDVAEHLARLHPERVAALHLTNVSPLHAVFADRSGLEPEELEYLETVARWGRAEGAYVAVQSSKPHTLAVGLADSPAGLAAWLLEKLHAWAHVPFDDDELLAWISAYWFTGAIGTSFATYAAPVRPDGYVATPTVLSTFAHDTKPAPLRFAARFINVREHVEHASGGHFAAWEEPEAYAADLRRAVALAGEGTRG